MGQMDFLQPIPPGAIAINDYARKKTGGYLMGKMGRVRTLSMGRILARAWHDCQQPSPACAFLKELRSLKGKSNRSQEAL